MRARKTWIALSTAAAAAGLLATTPACSGAGAERPAPAADAHPEVDADLESCASCHAEATPTVAEDWSHSRHGLALVKCFVCHGSTGADFRARPKPEVCRSCHAAQVASVTRDGAAKSCFACHPPHALAARGASPHGDRP